MVLLHGFGEYSSVWKYQTAFLKDHFRLVIPDIPGSGRSELLTGSQIYIDDYTEAVKAILDNEQISSCVLLGHSMGGYVSLAFAEKYPQYLLSFGLLHSSAFADADEKKQARLKSIKFIKASGGGPKGRPPLCFGSHNASPGR